METRRRKSDMQLFGSSSTSTNDRILGLIFGNEATSNNQCKRSKLENAELIIPVDDDNGDDNNDYEQQSRYEEICAESPPVDTIKYCTDPNWLTDFLNKEAENEMILPRDHNALFDKNCKLGSTKRAFCIDMQNAVAQNGMSFSQLNDVFEVLQRHTTSLKLPVIQKNPLIQNKAEDNSEAKCHGVRNNLHKYVGSDNRTCEIDVCQNDCVAFHGDKQIGGVKMSEMIFCPSCPAKRFSHCSHPDCKDKDYADCNPFKLDPLTGKRLNNHKRYAEKTLYYRPITAKLLQLYKLSLTEGNAGLLRYFQDHYRVKRTGTVCTS